MPCDSLCGILSGLLSGTYSDSLSGIYFDILSGLVPRLILIYLAFFLAGVVTFSLACIWAHICSA